MSSNRQILARPSGPSRSIRVNQETQQCRDDIRVCAQQPTLDALDLSRPNSIGPFKLAYEQHKTILLV
jgi:hypothetical protein